MTRLSKFRPSARRCAVVALSSFVLAGSAAAGEVTPVGSSDSAVEVAGKKTKTKISGRKIT